jgi:hypothetical protein
MENLDSVQVVPEPSATTALTGGRTSAPGAFVTLVEWQKGVQEDLP